MTKEELEKENKLLGERCLQLQKDKGELTDECKKLKVQLDFMERACDGAAEMYDDLKAARELIKSIIRVTWGEGWNYSLDWKVKAEQFLKEHE